MAPLEEKMLLVLSAPRKILGFWSSVPGTGAGWGLYTFSLLSHHYIFIFLGAGLGLPCFLLDPSA